MYFGSPDEVDAFTALPSVGAMGPVQQGRFAPIVGESFVMASSAPTVLSIPWMLDQYVPRDQPPRTSSRRRTDVPRPHRSVSSASASGSAGTVGSASWNSPTGASGATRTTSGATSR